MRYKHSDGGFKGTRFCQYGHHRQIACHRSGNQHRPHILQIIFDLPAQEAYRNHRRPNRPCGNQTKKSCRRQTHRQHKAETKRRYGMADQNDHTRNRIKRLPSPDRLAATQRNTYQIGPGKASTNPNSSIPAFSLSPIQTQFGDGKSSRPNQKRANFHTISGKTRQGETIEPYQSIQRGQILRTDTVCRLGQSWAYCPAVSPPTAPSSAAEPSAPPGRREQTESGESNRQTSPTRGNQREQTMKI